MAPRHQPPILSARRRNEKERLGAMRAGASVRPPGLAYTESFEFPVNFPTPIHTWGGGVSSTHA